MSTDASAVGFMQKVPSLGFFEGKKVLFLTHAGADVDSFCSAAALFFSLKKRGGCKIGVPEHISLPAKALAQKLSIPYTINPQNVEDFDAVFFLDFNSPQMLGKYELNINCFSKKIFVIDHHEKASQEFLPDCVFLLDKNAASCTEVVFDYLESSKIAFPPKVACLLACGIITDSARFSVASKNTFWVMHKLMEKSSLPYAELFSLFKVKTDASEKIARLKSARRCRIFKSFDKIIAASTVNAFEASSASSLVLLGADIAFAGGKKEEQILISARALNSFVSKSSFDITRHVFLPLSKKFPGKGGGHAGAAAFNGHGFDLQKALMECIELSHDFLEKKNKKKSTLKEFK